MNRNSGQPSLCSVLMPVHGGIHPLHLDHALQSTIEQTLQPDEIVLVKDGPLSSDLERVIHRWSVENSHLLRSIPLGQRRGAATALQKGLEKCSHALVARMDADDVNVDTRLEKQMAFMDQNPHIDVLGGWIGEFHKDPYSPDRVRKAPADAREVVNVAPFRCPINHMSVLYRKDSVIAVGGYDDRFRGIEDYHLWAKMLMKGSRMCNLPEILVHVRASDDLYRRRGGWAYARVEFRLEREFLRMGFVHLPQFLFNVVARLSVRTMPNNIRRKIYESVLRTAPLSRRFMGKCP